MLRRWPSSRFCVSNNLQLMEHLIFLSLLPSHPLKAAVLNLYSSIALCHNGAKKLLDSGNHSSLQLMVNCMDGLNPDYLKLAAIRLAECFVASEEGRIKLIELNCDPLVKAIIDVLSNKSLHLENLTREQMSLIKGACCVSKIICWPGKHHSTFWKLGIESVILKLLLPNPPISDRLSSLELLTTTSEYGLNADFLRELKPHVWDILGGLAEHCAKDFTPKSNLDLKNLISCACIGFVDLLRSTFLFRGNHLMEPVCKSVLLMIYSPSKDIALQVKSVLPKVLKRNAKEYINFLLSFPTPNQAVKLISLACFSSLPKYREYVRDNNGIKIMLSDIKVLLWEKRSRITPLRMNTNTSPHFCDHNNNTCCYESEDEWIGDKMFTVLVGVAELIRLYVSQKVQLEESIVSDIIRIMHSICIDYSASGPRWYAAYILSHFGIYGFPSKFGNRIGNIRSNPWYYVVDNVVVRVRCKHLQFSHGNVEKEALKKLLEYVYKGYLECENQDLVKLLKKLAREYNLLDLSQILDTSRPIWRTAFPKFDLTSALEPGLDGLSDIVLVPKSHSLDGWKCETCTRLDPHLHAHKAILYSSCEYIQGMLRSGMRESRVNCIKVDLGWEALVRLVNWFYSGEIVPGLKYDCLWRNLDEREKIKQMLQYVELYCLSDFWLLDDLKQECKTVFSTFLYSVDFTNKVREAVCHEQDMVGLTTAHELDVYMGNISTQLQQQGDT